MTEAIAKLYESIFGIYDSNYDIIFTALNEKSYTYFFLLPIVVPIIAWALFYYAWKYPYANFMHWAAWLLIVTVLVYAGSWALANSQIFSSTDPQLVEALADPSLQYNSYASTLPAKYAMSNVIISLLISAACSLSMKHSSKIQIHLPF